MTDSTIFFDAAIPSALGNLTEDYQQLKKIGLQEADLRKYFDEWCNSAVSILDENAVIIFANKACEKLSGYTKQELIGQSFALVSKTPINHVIEDIARRKEHVDERHVLTNKKQQEINTWATGYVIYNNSGKFIGSFFMLKDIHLDYELKKQQKRNIEFLETEVEKRTRELKYYAKLMEEEIKIREEAQLALFASEQRFRMLFYSSPEAIFVEEPDGTIIDINDAAAALYGSSREKMVGKNIKDFYGSDIVPIFEDLHEKILSGALSYFDTEIHLKNGSKIPVAIKTAVIHFDGKETILVHIRDISERVRQQRNLENTNKLLDKKVKERTKELELNNQELQKEIAYRIATQSQLKKQFEFFQMLIDINPNLIFIKNSKGEYILVNDAFVDFLKLSKEEIIGKTVKDIDAGVYRITELEQQDKIVLENPKQPFEFTVELSNGKHFRLMKQVVKGFDSDENLIMGVMIDLTDLKKNELRLTQSNEDLERFAYIASHDLQSPLKTIISFLQLLEHRYGNKLGADGKDFIEHSVSASTRMHQLITDLLHYARLNTAPKFSNTVDINQLLYVVTKNLDATIKDKKALIHSDPLPTIIAEPYLIVQLLQNIIDNGIKFVENRQPVIHISCSEKPKYWEFCIRDNGIGINKEFKEKIFKMFHRLHAEGKYSGTGIGLAVCKKVVDLHQGEIWIESEEGKGTTFFFTIAKNIVR